VCSTELCYDAEHLSRIALPVGGIGTGTYSVQGRGNLTDFQVMGKPDGGHTPSHTFLALRAQAADSPVFARALEGPIELEQYEGAFGARVANGGLPRFRSATFEAAYPFGQVVLDDADCPLAVRLQVFNPLVLGNVAASSHPVGVLRVCLENRSATPVEVSAAASLQNFIGRRGDCGGPKDNFFRTRADNKIQGIFGESRGVPAADPAWGTLALATLDAPGQTVSHRTSWAKRSWGDSLLDFWDDFTADGHLEDRDREDEDAPIGSLCARLKLHPGESRAVTFLVGWHFPNREAWGPPLPPSANGGLGAEIPARTPEDRFIGNHYTTQSADAWDAMARFAPQLDALEASTLAWVRDFCSSDLPQALKEAALNNLSTLRTQTVFRTPDGHFFGWEGIADTVGICSGTCTHVYNYEHTIPHVFSEMARSMREVEFLHALRTDGMMCFRVGLPLATRAREYPQAAADGQCGAIVKLYREWQMSGDDAWLLRLWPAVRRALEYCWIPGGWDADRDGVMEGCQHNTMDVEYYGPNPQMQGWYLAALRAVEEMARHLGEATFADECRGLFVHGSTWMDEHLWNGEYYEQEIRPIADPARIAPGLRAGLGAEDIAAPALQLGSGCLVDQLVGQCLATAAGLGTLHDPARVRRTLASILRHNRRNGFHSHFNHMRTFVLGNERGVLMATWPRGGRPARPFPYFNEAMTGFEYTVAIGLMQYGEREAGAQVTRDIRDRYDGRKRNPFNEAECGSHYARAMAAWGTMTAWTGFRYSAVKRAMAFRAAQADDFASRASVRWFWSNGRAWGTITQTRESGGIRATLAVDGGALELDSMELVGCGIHRWPDTRNLMGTHSLGISVLFQDKEDGTASP
jgi:uncharacterized protein (DUF608 family)